MVSYQAWTSIVFEVAKEQGAQYDGIQQAGETVALAAEIWNDRRAELRTATRSEARNVARREVSVS